MRVLYTVFALSGLIMCIGSLVWTFSARRTRRLWHDTHDTETMALVLELEQAVRAHDQGRGATTV
ncbi:MAG TPA: hypothetical protein VFR41_08765 [Acidimicrobiia bacterium]|nr:hypothetical protein [Acidimicrobiia bacterium]